MLCALNFFGQGSFQKAVGSDLSLGLSQPTVSRCLEEVVGALNEPEILAGNVRFPASEVERRTIITMYVFKFMIIFSVYIGFFIN